jgi:hypothetical protein|tara:strand:+ start:568 stop:765 length:198 start_codon:yes stop_codon:yes gene_type:complete
MKLKVTIQKDNQPFTEEVEVDEALAPVFVIGAIQKALISSELIDKTDKLEVLGSEESALLSKSGY